MEETQPQIKPPTKLRDVVDRNWKHVALVLIIALIGTVSFQVNITIGRKIEEAHQQGIEEGIQQENDRFFEEINKDLSTFGAYRFPTKIQDGTSTIETFTILVPPSKCQQLLNQ